ncbi:hypothetical protein COS77_03875 [Candidatus Roizmanbacteria bacterium CG06_land_8_20_14_3_00_34_14]|uniref:Peptidase M20 dimerisation domain-containing protein n=1 Tax=Candidatus Roizmanbacteria bacterium CG06_land_8_20_14_3_00_34_14 TaxID=1974848 RepID=A0A2M7ATR7_9BACT|nr:MAG: hypothetical protein COS77_03875 [Candidatus Roizmanbacteria bacterium CG06_land_8_20_14_3_00_34_14]
MNNVIDIFLSIVKIDSPSGKEGQISLFLQKWLTNNKFQLKIDTVGNIYAKNNVKGVPLLFCAHMDTVQPGENINPIVKNGIIKSDGKTILGADNKAAIAAIMSAVDTNCNRSLEILFTVKEETGDGVEHFHFEWIEAKKALIFDSVKPLGGIILRSPYIYNFDIQFTGKAAHSSTPNAGINAFIPAFKMLSKLPVGSIDKDETTINVGLVEGGTGINTIPNTIHIQGEVRSYSKKLFDQHLKKIKQLAEKYATKYKVKYTFALNGYCSGYTHSYKDPLIGLVSNIFLQSAIKPVIYAHSGVSDANVLNEHGIKTLNLSDGVQFPHTTSEQINVQDLINLSKLVQKCITEL